MNKTAFLVLPALLAVFSLIVISGGTFASAQFQDREIDLDCRDGMVMVHREISSSYVCVDMNTAERWAQLGLAVIVSQPEEEPAEEATMTEDADKETIPPVEKEAEMKEEMKKDDDISMLFVQTATSGTFTEDDGSYTLTLEGVSSQTIFFSDRPERIAGHLSTEDFVEEWGAGADSFADNPPNAAITVMSADDSENNIIVELTDPKYDADTMTIQYTASILEGDDNGKFFATNKGQIPAEFDDVSVFIDPSASGHLCVWTICVGGGVSANP